MDLLDTMLMLDDIVWVDVGEGIKLKLSPFIEEQIKASGIEVTGKELFPEYGKFTSNMIEKNIKDNQKYESDYKHGPYQAVCPGCPYLALFHSIKKAIVNRNVNFFITGDTGCMGKIRDYRLLDAGIDMGGQYSYSKWSE